VVRSVQALESLKSQLLTDQLMSVENPELRRRLSRAADDSASLAWATSVPLLALPELLAEKAQDALLQFERQQRIKGLTRPTSAQIELAA
jgi:hypothetical protein